MKKFALTILLSLLLVVSVFSIGCVSSKYTIEYELNGGTNTIKNPTSFASNKTLVLNEPEKMYHEFLGWYDNPEFSGKPITQIDKKKSSKVKLYAKWEYVGFEIMVMNGIASVVGTDPNLDELVIPDEYKGYPISIVTTVQSPNLYKVTLGKNVTTIEDGAFSQCGKIVEVYNRSNLFIGTGLDTHGAVAKNAQNVYTDANGESKIIKDGDFITYKQSSSNYPMIVSYVGSSPIMKLPQYDYTIHNNAFTNNLKIEKVVLTNSVKSIGAQAFYGCGKLVEVKNESTLNVASGAITNGYIGAYAANVYTPTFGQSKYSLSQDGFSFYNDSKSIIWGYSGMSSEIVLPTTHNSKTCVIASTAFAGNTIIKKVTIPQGMEIPSYAFYSATNLQEVEIGGEISSIGESAFALTSLKKVKINGKVENIGANAFNSCLFLPKISLPRGLKVIGANAFALCQSLYTVFLPSTLTTIQDNAFNGCEKLIEVYNESFVIVDKGSETNGKIGYYAQNVYTKTYGLSKIETVNDYVFYNDTSKSLLIAYEGEQNQLVLPSNHNGKAYDIYKYAFALNENIQSVNLGGAQEIGNYAFSMCMRIEEVIFTKSVNKIGNGAFSMCAKISQLVIPSSVETIGENSFVGCVKIEKLTIQGVKEIENSAFLGCVFLKELNIGNGVESIGAQAFSGCVMLETLTLPSSINKVGNSAFIACANLRYVDLGGAETVGIQAFYGCRQLGEVTLGKNLQNVGNNAFYECVNLFRVYNNSNLEIETRSYNYGYVGYYALEIISKNTDSKITEQNGFVFYEDSNNVHLIDYNGNAKTVVLPASFNGEKYFIEESAFYNNTNIEKVVIGGGVITVYNGAFNSCYNLKEIEVTSEDVMIDSGAFKNCFNVKSIKTTTMYNSISEWFIGSSAGTISGCPITLEEITFTGGKVGVNVSGLITLKRLYIQEGVISISSLSGCKQLEYVKIPSSIMSMELKDCKIKRADIPNLETYVKISFGASGYSIFSVCDNVYLDGQMISEIVIDGGITKINGNAFNGATNIKRVVVNGPITIEYKAFANCKQLESVQLNGNAFIDEFAFANCTKLESVELNGPTSISDYAFRGATSLVSVDLSSATYVGNYAFENCTSLEETTIGSDLIIGEKAFTGCANLQSVEMGSDVIVLKNAFSGCAQLTTLTAGENLNVENNAFENCDKLESFTFSTVRIGNYAFANCDSLKSVTITGSGTIETRAFTSCANLESVVANKVTKIGSDAFTSCSSLSTVSLQSVETISQYAFFLCPGLESVDISKATSIGDKAFYNATSLKEVILGELISVGASAFEGCVLLEDIDLTKLSRVETRAFYGCISITDGNLANVSTIGSSAFYGCGIQSLTIGNNVQVIGAYSFSDNASLQSVVVGRSVTSIQSCAFQNCKNLTKIINKSSLVIESDSVEHGSIGLYATTIINEQ